MTQALCQHRGEGPGGRGDKIGRVGVALDGSISSGRGNVHLTPFSLGVIGCTSISSTDLAGKRTFLSGDRSRGWPGEIKIGLDGVPAVRGFITSILGMAINGSTGDGDGDEPLGSLTAEGAGWLITLIDEVCVAFCVYTDLYLPRLIGLSLL